MKVVELDKIGGVFRVTYGGGKTRERFFKHRSDAEAFAQTAAGKRGSVVSTLDMTPEQLRAHIDHQRKLAKHRFAYGG